MLHVALAHPHLHLLVKERQHRQGVLHAAVNAAEGDRPTASNGINRGVERAETVHTGRFHGSAGERRRQHANGSLRGAGDGRAVGFHADRVDDGIGTAAVGTLTQLFDNPFAALEDLDAVAGCHVAPLHDGVYADDAVTQVGPNTGGHLPNRAEPEHREGAALRDVGVLNALPGGGQDIGEEQEALVLADAGNLHGAVIGMRDAQVLGLASGQRAVEARVAEQGGSAVVLTDLRGLTLRLQASLAHVAVPAGDGEGDDDAVAGLEVGDSGAYLLDDAHRLVSDNVALVHEGHEDLVKVQVGTADSGGSDADNGVGGFDDLRVGNFLDGHGAFRLPGQGFHWKPFKVRVRPRVIPIG